MITFWALFTSVFWQKKMQSPSPSRILRSRLPYALLTFTIFLFPLLMRCAQPGCYRGKKAKCSPWISIYQKTSLYGTTELDWGVVLVLQKKLKCSPVVHCENSYCRFCNLVSIDTRSHCLLFHYLWHYIVKSKFFLEMILPLVIILLSAFFYHFKNI